ncbi:hypothetical protein TRICI_001829 [Trichomonascus ciferrii]|uniref:Uncharacterized protein n=1 Tax=Trichomonascus ciferrii TaxID=44093 RepID=A0A642VCD4_9ASCO|nr:hypothetical protein TRICI_001829 [Trichomonascus ciferrii]
MSSVDASKQLSFENLDFGKVNDIKHLEAFCEDVIGRLLKLGVSAEIFKTPPSLAEVKIVNRLPENTLMKFWKEETRKSSYTTVPLDGVDHRIREANGQFYATPVENPAGGLICPKLLTDEQVVEFKLLELNVNDPNTQNQRLFTAVERLDKMLVGNPFYDRYRKDKVDSVIYSWEEAEEYYQTYHTSVIVCSSPTVVSQVKKALFLAAMIRVEWATDVPQLLNSLKDWLSYRG